eukprot:m.141694 g.141694  ORF g.141694 m.141694 type:complete len:281 (-) comp11564_c0_seq2:330-1172(-)
MSPTTSPTLSPTVSPTQSPTVSPTLSPTDSPTVSPTLSPTTSPTLSPTQSPTVSPTLAPTVSPTVSPTFAPTNAPTHAPTAAPTCAATRLELVFVVDASASVPASGFQESRDFIVDTTDRLTIGPSNVRAAIINFSFTARLHLSLADGTSQSAIDTSAADMQAEGSITNTHLGLDLSRTHLASVGRSDAVAPHMVVVLTDGSSSDPSATVTAANNLLNAGVDVLAIGVGNVNVTELNIITGNANRVFQIADFTTLDTVVDQIATLACQTSSSSPPPPPPP